MDFQDYLSPSESQTPCSECDRGTYKQTPSRGRKSRTDVASLEKRNNYPYPSYEDVLAITGDIAPDKAIFYSGLGYYPGTTGYDMFKAYIAANSFLEVDNIYAANCRVSDLGGFIRHTSTSRTLFLEFML